ncbi:type II toxin-antitoxin system HicB family antitoxin [Curtobacterium citreum]
MINTEHYTYRVRWSAEDDAYVGTVAELPSMSWIEDTSVAAFTGIRTLVADTVKDMLADGETPPEPLGERTFSGNFVVRLAPEQHRQLTIDAFEQHVSLNKLANIRLASK